MRADCSVVTGSANERYDDNTGRSYASGGMFYTWCVCVWVGRVGIREERVRSSWCSGGGRWLRGVYRHTSGCYRSDLRSSYLSGGSLGGRGAHLLKQQLKARVRRRAPPSLFS